MTEHIQASSRPIWKLFCYRMGMEIVEKVVEVIGWPEQEDVRHVSEKLDPFIVMVSNLGSRDRCRGRI